MNGFKIWVQYFDKQEPFRPDGFITNNNNIVIFKSQSECEHVIMGKRDAEKSNKKDTSEVPHYIIFDEAFEGDYWHTVKLTGNHKDLDIDQAKSNKATQFIGIGSPEQKTYQYAIDWDRRANTGIYHDYDIVYVSIDNNSKNAITIDNPQLTDLLDRAIEANATIITDNAAMRDIDKNNGERDLAFYLRDKGYADETDEGVWVKQEPVCDDEQLELEQPKQVTITPAPKPTGKKGRPKKK